MAEYIKRDTAIRAVMAAKWVDGSDGAMAMEIVASPPAADVAPVVHGRWEIDDFWSDNVQITGKCAACSEIISWFNELPNYCPNCGARMDGGAE